MVWISEINDCIKVFSDVFMVGKSLWLLDLCLKFFQYFVTWEISQSERKPEPVESALPSAAEFKTHAGSPVRFD